MRRCTTILIMCVALFSACSSPRKACRKAERHIARAVWLCPDVLARDSATVVIRPDSVSRAAVAVQPNLDSLLAACEQLNAALAARQQPTPPIPASSIPAAVQRIQRAACTWESFTERIGRISITVRNVAGQPLLTVVDPGEMLRVPCPPMVNKVEVTGVATWYRTFTWIVIGWITLLLVVGVISFIRSNHAR